MYVYKFIYKYKFQFLIFEKSLFDYWILSQKYELGMLQIFINRITHKLRIVTWIGVGVCYILASGLLDSTWLWVAVFSKADAVANVDSGGIWHASLLR